MNLCTCLTSSSKTAPHLDSLLKSRTEGLTSLLFFTLRPIHIQSPVFQEALFLLAVCCRATLSMVYKGQMESFHCVRTNFQTSRLTTISHNFDILPYCLSHINHTECTTLPQRGPVQEERGESCNDQTATREEREGDKLPKLLHSLQDTLPIR